MSRTWAGKEQREGQTRLKEQHSQSHSTQSRKAETAKWQGNWMWVESCRLKLGSERPDANASPPSLPTQHPRHSKTSKALTNEKQVLAQGHMCHPFGMLWHPEDTTHHYLVNTY